MNDDDLFARVRTLPTQVLTPEFSARVSAQASALFAQGARAGAGAFAGRATAAALVSAVAIYLTWAVDFLNVLAR
jgi:hypothetical protein